LYDTCNTGFNTTFEINQSITAIINTLSSDVLNLKSQCDQMFNKTDVTDPDSLKASIEGLLNSLQT